MEAPTSSYTAVVVASASIPRPHNRYNIFFILERARLIQATKSPLEEVIASLHIPANEPPQHTGYECLDLPELPPRYRALVLTSDWYVPGKNVNRKHVKTHNSVVSFRELARTVADNWKSADNATVKYCTAVAKIQKDRHALLLRGSATSVTTRRDKMDSPRKIVKGGNDGRKGTQCRPKPRPSAVLSDASSQRAKDAPVRIAETSAQQGLPAGGFTDPKEASSHIIEGNAGGFHSTDRGEWHLRLMELVSPIADVPGRPRDSGARPPPAFGVTRGACLGMKFCIPCENRGKVGEVDISDMDIRTMWQKCE